MSIFICKLCRRAYDIKNRRVLKTTAKPSGEPLDIAPVTVQPERILFRSHHLIAKYDKQKPYFALRLSRAALDLSHKAFARRALGVLKALRINRMLGLRHGD